MVYKQNYANFREYIDPIRDMQPKLVELKNEFKETLDKYKKTSKVAPDSIKCEKGDKKSIRRY